MSTLDVATLTLSILSMNRFAARRTRQFRSAGTNTWWAAGFLIAALALRLLFGNAGLLGNALFALRDLGIGLVLGWFWIRVDRGPAPAWLVSGGLLTAVGFWLAPASGMKEVLLELGPDDAIEEVQAILDRHDASAAKAFPEVDLAEDEDVAQFFLVRCPADQMAALIAELKADSGDVDSAEPNDAVALGPVVPASAPDATAGLGGVNDPHAGEQWGLVAIDGEAALKRLGKLKPKKVALVAIADTGVESSHEDLGAIFVESPGNKDEQGHGTHCAGIAGAGANNGIGVASLNYEGRFVKVLGFAALGADGSGSVESVAQAIIDAADAGADVISLSLGGYHPTPPKAEVEAIDYALKRGAIVVVAAGNESDDAAEHSPANVPGVIVVTATDRNGSKANFSNTANTLEHPIAAPGVDIFSLGLGNGYVPMSGTSMATPMVAGLLGVMRSLQPGLTAQQAYDILKRTGTRGPDAGTIGMTIDADAALAAVVE